MEEREFLDKDKDVFADALSLSLHSQSVHTHSIQEEDYISLSLMEEEGEIIEDEDDASHVSEVYSQVADDYTEGEYTETDYTENASDNNRYAVAITFIKGSLFRAVLYSIFLGSLFRAVLYFTASHKN